MRWFPVQPGPSACFDCPLADEIGLPLRIETIDLIDRFGLRRAALAPINHFTRPQARSRCDLLTRDSAHIVLALTRAAIAHVLHAHECG